MKNKIKFLLGVLALSLMQSAANAEMKTREIELKNKLLLVPVSEKPAAPDAKKNDRATMLEIRVGETLVHKLNVVLADSKEDIAWWGYLEMDEYAGKTAKLSANVEAESKGLDLIESSGTIRNPEPLYKEELRPRFHFMPKQGWSNDPNGLIYADGEYHFFWQCNPLGKQNAHEANMYWGHAVSKDLLHWEELPRAMRPLGGQDENRHPSMAVGSCWSGSANIDDSNILGFQKGGIKTMVAAYTDTGCGEVLAYSTDRGRNWTYDKSINPIIKHQGRDPMLVWYPPSSNDSGMTSDPGHWVIAVYDEEDKSNRGIAFYSSTDLKTWTKTSFIKGYFECPQLFELPVDGDKKNTRWIICGGNARYTIGKFDGKTFTPDQEAKYKVFDGQIYAGQCFHGTPGGRVIYVGWAINVFIPMPATFNQGFTVPVEFTLKTTKEGIRMFANPIKELDQLRDKALVDLVGEKAAKGASVEAPDQEYDILITLKKTGDKGACSLRLGGHQVKLPAVTGETMDVRILVDRTTIEVVENGGAAFRLESRQNEMGKPVAKIEIKPEGGVTVEKLQIFKMKSALPE